MNTGRERSGGRPDEAAARAAEDWVARLHSPECSNADRELFQAWLSQDATHWQARNSAERVWASAKALHDDADLNAMAEGVLKRRLHRARTIRFGTRLLASAAVLALAMLGGFDAFRAGWFSSQPAAVVYSTAIGEIRSFTLDDQSVITLDTDSVVEVRMERGRRRLQLRRGDANFEVAHDPGRPFTVTTSDAQVTALGTVFQVGASMDGTEVSLLQGSVQVSAVDNGAMTPQSQLLAPGERLGIARDARSWTRGRVDVEAANAWLSGRLVFDAMPLRDAVAQFNRYSPRKLRIADAEVGAISISGVFNVGDAGSITLALQRAYPLRVDDTGNETILSRK